MSLISLIIMLALCGFVAWLVLQIPMPQVMKNIIIGVMALFMVLWVLQSLGVTTNLPALRLR